MNAMIDYVMAFTHYRPDSCTFSLCLFKETEEIVLRWEWDDGGSIHEFPGVRLAETEVSIEVSLVQRSLVSRAEVGMGRVDVGIGEWVCWSSVTVMRG